jgi:hypothetical protein
MDWIEWFGYLASIVVALSLTMSSIVRLRWLNLLGAGMFSTYGFIIDALPVGFLNLFIVFANIYYLHDIYRQQDRFHLVEAKLGDPLVRYWLSYYKDEILRHFPDWERAASEHPLCRLMLRNSEPVGLMVGSRQQDTFNVALDYVFPAYQDFKTGHYLYQQSGFFSGQGVSRVRARTQSARHQAYLSRMGFSAIPSESHTFEYRVEPTAS